MKRNRLRTAVVSFFSHRDGLVVSVVTPDSAEPLVVEVPADGPESPSSRIYLSDAVTRLLIDVHGLPGHWDSSVYSDRYTRALALPPAVNAVKRSGPVLQRKLHTPAYHYDTDYLAPLGAALLPAPVRREIETCEVLCFVPHGPLHALPFAALGWEGHTTLGERFGLAEIPSASLLPLLQHRNPARGSHPRPRSVFTAAVAAVEDHDPDDFERDNDFLAVLSADLGGSCDELRGPSGPSAVSKLKVLERAPGHDAVHLACHGVFLEGPGDPMETSGLLLAHDDAAPSLREVMAGGTLSAAVERHLLTAEEVLSMSLDAELVTLRACSSGRSTVAAGDELLGLVRAFLFAGATSLLASLWNVNKLSSRLLLHEFYRLWLPADGLSKWQAMQRAQRAVRETPEYKHPFHWAPFALIGDWI